tara:strand:+ start:5839 stop:6147 length:309 start_codon:yes stop_codon:yes gene_type:complete
MYSSASTNEKIRMRSAMREILTMPDPCGVPIVNTKTRDNDLIHKRDFILSFDQSVEPHVIANALKHAGFYATTTSLRMIIPVIESTRQIPRSRLRNGSLKNN